MTHCWSLRVPVRSIVYNYERPINALSQTLSSRQDMLESIWCGVMNSWFNVNAKFLFLSLDINAFTCWILSRWVSWPRKVVSHTIRAGRVWTGADVYLLYINTQDLLKKIYAFSHKQLTLSAPASLSVYKFSLHYPHKISCLVMRI